MLKEKEKLMREYNNDLKLRDNEMESMKISFNEEIAKKEKEKLNFKTKIEDES